MSTATKPSLREVLIDYRLEDLPEKFRQQIRIRPDSGCWEWTGSLEKGYGRWGKDRIHRVVYRLLVGPIPEDRPHLDHVKTRGCISKACCWPAHLEPVTQAENTRITPATGHRYCRACARERYAKKVSEGGTVRPLPEGARCPQGHEYTAENTYIAPVGYRQCRICKREAYRQFELRRAGKVA